MPAKAADWHLTMATSGRTASGAPASSITAVPLTAPLPDRLSHSYVGVTRSGTGIGSRPAGARIPMGPPRPGENTAPRRPRPRNPNGHLGRQARIQRNRVMDEAAPTFVGIDVAKHRLEIHLRPSGEGFTIDHGEEVTLVERLAALEPMLVVLEATGGMEVSLAAASEFRTPGAATPATSPIPTATYGRWPGTLTSRCGTTAACGCRRDLGRGTAPPSREAEADQGGGEVVECLEDVDPPLVTDGEPAEAGEPGQGALYYPPVPAEPFRAVDPAPRDPRGDPATAAGPAAPPVIVRLVGMPPASTRTWRLVPGLPRSVGFGPVSSPPLWPARSRCRASTGSSRSRSPRPAGRAARGGGAPTPRPPASPGAFASRSCRSRSPSPGAASPKGCRT
jgi:hypothetical protein